MRKIIFTLFASATLANATITINGGTVGNLGDELGVGLTSSTTYAVLVALNPGSDLFNGLEMSDTISIGQTVGDGRYYVLHVGSTFDSGPNGQMGFAAGVYAPLAGAVGNQVAFVWFPDLVGSVLSEGDVYGVIRDSTWIWPSDGSDVDFNSFVGTLKTAQFIVAIPEPTGIVLLGLGAFALMARRRRD